MVVHTAALLFAAGIGAVKADFHECRLDLGSDRAIVETFDVDQDGLVDLVLSIADEEGRALRIHRQRADHRFVESPDWQMRLPPDVTAYLLGDVREEPGLELLLLTRSGIVSVSPAQASLRGNLRRELSLPLFPDVPPSGPAPCWRASGDLDGDGQWELLLLGAGTWTVLGSTKGTTDADATGAGGLRILDRFPAEAVARSSEENTRMNFGNGMSVQSRAALVDLFPGAPRSRGSFGEPPYLDRDIAWRVPLLVDLDGDGRSEIGTREKNSLELRSLGGNTVVADLGSLRDDPDDLSFADADGDRLPECFEEDSEDGEHVLVVHHRSAADQAFAPSARLKLEGTGVDYDALDVDGDGFLDVIARVFDVPRSITGKSDARLDVSLLIFRGGPGATLGKRPAFRDDRRLRPEDLAQVRESLLYDLRGDFDGDGLHDLLTMRPDGLLQIHRLLRDGEDLRRDEEPLAHYLPTTRTRSVEPRELTGDHVSDLILRHERALTVFLSVPEDER